MSKIFSYKDAMANFKGVMLCERPAEPGDKVIIRPYCGRVTGKEQLGLCPTEIRERKEKKCKRCFFKVDVMPALVNHKKWLKEFNEEMQNRKDQAIRIAIEEEKKKETIRKNAEKMRKEIMEADLNSEEDNLIKENLAGKTLASNRPLAEPKAGVAPEREQRVTFEEKKLERSAELAKDDVNMKKKDKRPAWALSQKENENFEEEEDEELIDFMDNLNFEEYIEDLEVKNMLETLKKKITDLKGEQNWKKKWEQRVNQKKEKKRQEYLREKKEKEIEQARAEIDNSDNVSVAGASIGEQAGTVLSSKTQGKKKF